MDPGKFNPDKDRSLTRRAIRERWPIPDDVRQAIANRMVELVRDGKPRDANQAARNLIAMEAQVQADEHLEAKLGAAETAPAAVRVVIEDVTIDAHQDRPTPDPAPGASPDSQ